MEPREGTAFVLLIHHWYEDSGLLGWTARFGRCSGQGIVVTDRVIRGGEVHLYDLDLHEHDS
jgi:hypothetical protein